MGDSAVEDMVVLTPGSPKNGSDKGEETNQLARSSSIQSCIVRLSNDQPWTIHAVKILAC